MIENISGVMPLSVETAHPPPAAQSKMAAAATPSGNAPAAPTIVAQAAAVQMVGGAQAAGSSVDRDTLEAATKDVQEFVAGLTNDLDFSIDEDTGMQVVKIVDIKTKEVLRQIPAEEMLAIAKALDKIKGLFVKGTA
ncbi:MAG: flagellar protein FlaG [Betaproteobacteria bacterium]|nr:flagellar protein FlaG [Betaproteobacteria bacterium]